MDPDLDALTTSGRVNAPEPPEEPTPLDELTVAELGSCYVEGYNIVCESQNSDACVFSFGGPAPIQDYSLGMLAVYPECEACGDTLVVKE